MPHAFSERLAEGALLCDGAMGTVLYARGCPLDACFDVLNVNNARLVQAVHADYVTADEAREVFREQAEALLEGGVDAFVVETFSDLTEIGLAVAAIRSITDLPVIAQMAFTDEGVTFMG